MAKKKAKKTKKLKKKGKKRYVMQKLPDVVDLEDLKIDDPAVVEEIVESIPVLTAKKKSTQHYIDNDKLFAEMVVYRDAVLAYKKNPDGAIKPKVSEYIGECILKIAERLSTKPNFVGYSYRDEMVSDGIENCLMYIDNFNPAKSKNPFAYFTQIIYFAFIRRLQKEKKQSFIKMRAFENCDVKGKFRQWARDVQDHDGTDNPYADYFKLSNSDIAYWDKKSQKKKKAKIASKKIAKNPKKTNTLDEFLQ